MEARVVKFYVLIVSVPAGIENVAIRQSTVDEADLFEDYRFFCDGAVFVDFHCLGPSGLRPC